MGEVIWEGDGMKMVRKVEKDAFGNMKPAGCQCEPGKSNHGVAPPIGKPVVAGNHRLVLPTGNNELISRAIEPDQEFTMKASLFSQQFLTRCFFATKCIR